MSTATTVWQAFANPPRELVDFAKRQAFNARCWEDLHERRSDERIHLVLSVVVQPVDEHFSPVGDSFDVVTRDLSPKGVGLIHLAPIHDRFLALHMIVANTEVNVAARVVWRKPLGPFYGTGAEFISKLKDLPPSEELTGCETKRRPYGVSPSQLSRDRRRTRRATAANRARQRDGG